MNNYFILLLLLITTSLFAASPGDVIFTEVLMRGAGDCNDAESEFIEIYNTTNSAIDIAGWVLSDGTEHTIVSGNPTSSFGGEGNTIIPANGFLVMVQNGGSFGNCTGAWPAAGYDYNSVAMSCADDDLYLYDGNPSGGANLISRILFSGAPTCTNGVSYYLRSIADAPDGLISGSELGNSSVALSGSSDNFASPGSSGQSQLVLPVELLSFTAKNISEFVQLDWVTATELNNEGFDIERSIDIKNWKVLEFVKGQGNSNALTSYQYIDEKPLKSRSYYRLRQIDFDGAYEYSDIAVVDSKIEAPEIYPNPTQYELHLKIPIGQEKPEFIEILDYAGEILLHQSTNDFEGRNNVFSFTTTNLQSGIYFIKVNYEKEKGQILKFIKK